VVVTGAGERSFMAGADLKELGSADEAAARDWITGLQAAHQAIRDCPVPVICAVNGAAYGGGCEFALGCDFIYAASHARFALTEVTLGIMPGAAGTINLPHAVGERRAREIIYTGSPFSAEEGHAWGLINQVCEADSLLEETLVTARRIAGNAPISIRQAKKSIALATQVDRNSAYMFELEAYNRMVPTADRLEGVRAFNEKRKPRFEGR
jgi:enoyl-CoA hydratase